MSLRERERQAGAENLFNAMLDWVVPGYRFRVSQKRLAELRRIAGLSSRPHLKAVNKGDKGRGVSSYSCNVKE